jgi:hypothetical protein
MTTTAATRTIITTDGDIIATGVSPQRVTAIVRRTGKGTCELGWLIVRGNVADAKAACAAWPWRH